MEKDLIKLQDAIKAQLWPFATVHETIPFKHLDGQTLLYVHTNECHVRPDELLSLASMVDVCHVSADDDSAHLVVTCMWIQESNTAVPAAPDVQPDTASV